MNNILSIFRPPPSTVGPLSSVLGPQPSAIRLSFATLSRWIIYALLVFTPLARGSVQPWAVTVIHLGVLAALAAFFLETTVTGKWTWIATPLDRPLACIWGLCLLATVFSQYRPGSLQALGLLADYTVIFYLTVHLFDTRKRVRHLIWLLVGMAVWLTLFGIFKRFDLNPFEWWTYPELPYSAEFMAGTYGNHNHLAGYLEMALPLACGAMIFARSSASRALWAYLASVLIAGLALSLSRGGWLASMVSLAFLLSVLARSRYFFHKHLLFAGVIAVVVIGLVVLASTPVVRRMRTVTEGDKAASLESRIQAWQGVVAMISDHPWLGAGPGTFGILGGSYQPVGLTEHFKKAHNDYLQFTAEVGLGLVPILFWSAAALWGRCRRRLKHHSRLIRGVTTGGMAGILAMGVHSLVDFNLQIPANAMVFTILVALVAAPLRNTGSRQCSQAI